MTERSCDDCRHQWPAERPTPKGDRYFVPVCRRTRNAVGLAACTLARSYDGPCGPDALLWARIDD